MHNPTSNRYSSVSPYGMQMPGRHFSSADGHRYGFQGQEHDDEIKGKGNSINYQARIYDPRIGRWFAVDPLTAKYPYESPYGFTGNSTVINRENNGKDYGIFIDHDTRQITIKAVFYVEQGDVDAYNSAVAATAFWNKESGKYQYQVGKGKNKIVYDINIEISVETVLNANECMKEGRTEKGDNQFRKKDADGNYMLIYEGITNTYSIRPDSEVIQRSEEINAAGYSNGTNIVVSESSKDNKVEGAHEVGHNLGLHHWPSTIMNDVAAGFLGVYAEMIGQILRNGDIGKGSDWAKFEGAQVVTHQSNEESKPKDFEKGKVKKKKD